MEHQLTALWYGEHPAASLLQPLASCYGALVALRRRAYRAGWLRSGSVGKPVVVVGNLTVGGTGKTPLTLWLARELGALGLEVGIVSRGYGRSGGEPRRVKAGSSWREVGDEPLILARRSGCQTMVAADRLAAARGLAARGVDVILADDGLQHLHLARDCEIVVIDGMRGFGNGRLLPAGPLREPAVQLWQADAVVVNGVREHPSLAQALPPQGTLAMRLIPLDAERLDARASARPLEAFRGLRVHAVAGIGNPQRFFAVLREHGMEVIEHAFADHHAFVPADLGFADQLPVLMTEKDAVKCTAFADARLWYVPVSAELSAADAEELLGRVLAKVRAAPAVGGQF
jgi:tetraacyldisaccharide 4'-kinase